MIKVLTLLLVCSITIIMLQEPELALFQEAGAEPIQAAEFKEYVTSFESITGDKVNVSIQFATDFNFKRTELGYALLDAKRPYQASIYIKRSTWASLGPMQRKGLIWHELAHSLYGSDHESSVGLDKCPNSIMHSRAIEERCWVEHESIYSAQLKALKADKGSSADVYIQLKAGKR